MNVKGIICVLIIFLFFPQAVKASSEARNIYVGDIITIEVTANNISKDALSEKFQGFDVLEIKDSKTGYLISMRSFEVGEHIVAIGDKELVITVASTLTDIDREDIFEGEMGVIKATNPFYKFVIFYVFCGVFVIALCFTALKALKKVKNIEESNYQLFIRRTKALLVDDENYFVSLTLYFKEYIECKYNCKLKGKTTTEIVKELKEVPDISVHIPSIENWLIECDRLKFSGVKVSNEEKVNHYKKLLALDVLAI